MSVGLGGFNSVYGRNVKITDLSSQSALQIDAEGTVDAIFDEVQKILDPIVASASN